MEETTGGSVWGTSEFSFTEDEQVEPTSPNPGQGYLDPYHFYAQTTAAPYPPLSSFGVVPAGPTIPNLSPAFLPWPINGNIPTHMPVHDNNANPQAIIATYIPSHGHRQEYPRVPSQYIQHPSQSSTNNSTLTTADQNSNTQHKTTRATKALTHNSTKPEQWRCDEKGCKYRGTFARKAEMKRHIESLHVNPGLHECPLCGSQHNRKDNLVAHLKTRH
ncbi:hypothetical protein BDV41DRAFT_578873 [Aspergillus transmontanensis]|uniref:C2H2-type domain-containing protein n=1 Tax=Aspergillus transmontanensis TaxID=1034304 RepID=A0A5N6VRS7_9EURO|nr:hypothetical protein BDV41DRAFT_578873 [Aspergillus transmontanensis]